MNSKDRRIDFTAMSRAFELWWSERFGNAQPTETEREAFEHAWLCARGISRAGSDVRGRVVVYLRPMTDEELAREGWSSGYEPRPICLELDDGTLVYPAFMAQAINGGTPVPALFFAYSALRGQKLLLTASQVELQVEAQPGENKLA